MQKTGPSQGPVFFHKSMDEQDEFFLKKALSEAEKARDKGEVPVGAVLVCDNKIITKSHNQVELLNDATAHAEMLAITAGCAHFQSKYLPDCTLYVSLEPCPMCAAALYWTQIGRVVWAASDEKRGFTRYAPHLLHPKTTFSHGILAQESAQIIRDFFSERR